MATSSLRQTILKHSIPLLPSHSFTRQTLSAALSSLPSTHPDYRSETPDSIIDTLFGPGTTAPAQALAEGWAEEGLTALQGSSVRDRLRGRLEYSSRVNEHLVEAYALMSSPSSTSSLPMPSIPPAALSLLRQFKLPPPYIPPHARNASAPSATPLATDSQILDEIYESTNGRIPFLSVNPLGPLSYAWNIADAALRLDEQKIGVVKGIMDEPTGQGPEWYTSRISLLFAYLAAESHLLQPYPAKFDPAVNPHLTAAEIKLDEHLGRYEQAAKTINSGEQGLGQFMGFLGYAGRTAVGMVKSRGF